MKILLTGKNGQLGWELERALAPLGELAAYDRTMLDLAKPDQIAAAVRSVKPDIIVNAAACSGALASSCRNGKPAWKRATSE